MPSAVLADVAVSISELKKHPSAALDAGNGRPVAIMNHNVPTHYAVPAEMWARMLEAMDDAWLNRLCDERAHETPVEVTLDDL